MKELVEMELRELLDPIEFPGDDTPIICGSALMALEGKETMVWERRRSRAGETLDYLHS